MKKFLSMILTALLLCGCVNTVKSNIPEIEDLTWEMNTVQEKSGKVIACSAKTADQNPDAWKLKVILSASNGTLEINDMTNGSKFYVEYTLESTDRETRLYSLKAKENRGYAIVGTTSMHGQEEKDTLILAIENYVLNFYRE